MAKRILLVGNPTAQSGRAAARIEAALGKLAARGHAVQFQPTAPGGLTVQLVKDRLAGGGYDVVVYLGGDGTFREVAKGVIVAGGDIPMGMLPSGTANDQGKSFGISASSEALDRNVEVIDRAFVRPIDAGRIVRLGPDGVADAEDLFFDSAGFGLNPDILARRNLDREVVGQIPLLREVYRDQLVYAGAALRRYLASWVEPTKFRAEIVSDGVAHVYDGLTDLILKATAIYGGSWVLDRESEPDDGLFEVVPIQGRRDWFSKGIRDLAVFPIDQGALDKVGVTHSEGFRGGHFEITLERPGRQDIQSQIDGEEWKPGGRFRVEVVPRVLPLIVPERWRAPWKRRS